MNSHLSIGIVGLPNVGKSTLFQAITKKQVDCSNYPFCTIEPNVGVVAVPDERVDKLTELTKSAKKIYATVEFVDIAGLVAGAHKGEGLGNQFLSRIREVDAIVYVLRGFGGEAVANVLGSVDPLKEKEILDTELMLKDLESLQKRLEGLGREAKSGKKEMVKELEIVTKAYNFVKDGLLLFEQEWNDEEKRVLKNYQLLTLKPQLYLLNNPLPGSPTSGAPEVGLPESIIMDVLAELEAESFSIDERKELGLRPESAVDILIKKSFELLGLISFFTILSNEVRAWPIKKGTKVPQAGGNIHGDFEEKFIRAEAINWKDLVGSGSWSKAREKGLIRTEGKEYVVQDGDVVEIRHS